MAKKASPAPAKKAPKTPSKVPPAPAKKAAAKSNGHARSATNGGHVPKERYAKDPKSVVTRLKEKADKALTQAANAVVRAEKAGITSPAVAKLQASMNHFEAAKKALA